MSRAIAKSRTEVQPEPMSENQTLMALLNNPNIDMDNWERAAALIERREKLAAEMAFNAALSAAQAEMEPVVKNARNNQTQSNYADIGALADKITPIYTRHGFGTTFGTDASPIPGYFRTVGELCHAGGFTKTYYLDLPLDNAGIAGKVNKTDTHATGSTLTYARRYIKLMMFDIATKDDRDGNKPRNDGPAISEEQVTAITNRIELQPDVHDMKRFMGWLNSMGVSTIADLPASKFEMVVRELKKKEANFAAQQASEVAP